MLLTKVAGKMSQAQVAQGKAGLTPSKVTKPTEVSQTLEAFIEGGTDPATTEEVQAATLDAAFTLTSETIVDSAERSTVPRTPPRARRRAHSWGNSPSGQRHLHFPLVSQNLSTSYRPTHRLRGKQPPRTAADPYELPSPPRNKSEPEQELDGPSQSAEVAAVGTEVAPTTSTTD